MTDKEIIVDGVNIIDCDYFYVEQETDQVKCDNYSGYCREHKNCPFKQLARKTQECEKYRKALDNVREYICNNTNFDISDAIQNKTAGYDILQIIKGV